MSGFDRIPKPEACLELRPLERGRGRTGSDLLRRRRLPPLLRRRSPGLLRRHGLMRGKCRGDRGLSRANPELQFPLGSIPRLKKHAHSVTEGEHIQLKAAQLNMEEYNSPRIPGYVELHGNHEKNLGCCQCVMPGYRSVQSIRWCTMIIFSISGCISSHFAPSAGISAGRDSTMNPGFTDGRTGRLEIVLKYSTTVSLVSHEGDKYSGR